MNTKKKKQPFHENKIIWSFKYVIKMQDVYLETSKIETFLN